jgi:hypothetical protein
LAKFKRKDSLGYNVYLNRPKTNQLREWAEKNETDLSNTLDELINRKLGEIAGTTTNNNELTSDGFNQDMLSRMDFVRAHKDDNAYLGKLKPNAERLAELINSFIKTNNFNRNKFIKPINKPEVEKGDKNNDGDAAPQTT